MLNYLSLLLGYYLMTVYQVKDVTLCLICFLMHYIVRIYIHILMLFMCTL